MKSPSLLALLLILALVSVQSIHFSLRQSEETCLSKEVLSNDYVNGQYQVIPEGEIVGVTIKDSLGDLVYNKPGSPEGSFAYTAPRTGPYKICFANSVTPGLKSIKLSFATSAEAAPVGAAKKSNLKPLEAQMQHLQNMVDGIKTDESWLTSRNVVMKGVNDSTAMYILVFNILLLIITVASYFGQLWYLKRYFRARKLVVD